MLSDHLDPRRFRLLSLRLQYKNNKAPRTNPKIATAAKDIPTIWPVFRLPCAEEVVEPMVGDKPEVLAASDSAGCVVVEDDTDAVDVGGLVEAVSRKDKVEEEVGKGGSGEKGAGVVEGAPVAVVILVVSTLVVVGAPIAGGSAEENAFEPGVR